MNRGLARSTLARGMLLLAVALAACSSTMSPSGRPTSSAAPSVDPRAALGQVPWVAAQRTWNANDQPLAEFRLLGGWAGDDIARFDLQVPMAFMAEPMEWGRQPAVAVSSSGQVVYVADDGEVSAVRRIGIGDLTDAAIAELPGIVWSVALAPDDGVAYLLTLDRATGRESGVWAVPVSGGEPVQVMEPAGLLRAARGIALAALLPFSGELYPSLDGSRLARRICSSQDGPFTCSLDVLDRATGRIQHLEASLVGRVIGLVDRYLVSVPECGELECPTVVEDLVTRARSELPPAMDGVTLTQVNGRPVVAWASDVQNMESHAIAAESLETGERSVILRSEPSRPIAMLVTRQMPALPVGWVLVDILDPPGRLAVRVADGAIVQLDFPDWVDMRFSPPAVPAAPTMPRDG